MISTEEHYKKLARMRADHYQKINRANNTEWFDIYQEGLGDTELLDEYEAYLMDLEEARYDGEL